jgi:dipeptidyl aminopeptidase/acylaminoacyl peptidase
MRKPFRFFVGLITLIAIFSSANRASALTPADVTLDALSTKKFNGSNLTLIKLLAQTSKYTKHSITYRSDDLKVSGVLYTPKGKGPFPGIVLGHGYIDPKIYKNGQGMRREQNYLASRGYVVLHTDYRNHSFGDDDPESQLKFRMDYSADVINAGLALKNSKIRTLDKNKIAYMGRSMGGGIGFNVAVATSARGVFSSYVLFAPTSANYVENFNKWGRNNPDRANPITKFVGLPEANPDFWASISPKNYWPQVSAPIMIHHGDKDRSCPVRWARAATKGLKGAGKAVTLHIYRGEGHDLMAGWGKAMARSIDFFNQNWAITSAGPEELES